MVLSEYVSHFNKLRIFTNTNETINFNVGQYYLEKYYMSNTTNSKLAVDNFHTIELGNSYEGDFVFTSNEKPIIEVYVPQKFKDLKILEQNLVLTNSDALKYSYKYNCTIPEKYFNNIKLSTICFDAVLVGVDTVEKNKKSELMKYNEILTSDN